MKPQGDNGSLTRRRFVASTAALPFLGNLALSPAFAEETRKEPPYLALARRIDPQFSDFPGERTAAETVAALHSAVRTKSLPFAPGFEGSSPAPVRLTPLAPDVSQAEFSSADHDVAQGWSKWVASLGTIRRIDFYPLAANVVRYEVASEREGKLFYRVGCWRQKWGEGKLLAFSPVEEHDVSAERLMFRDVTLATVGACESFSRQLARGIPYWRSRLDPATGIDIYGSNGISAGDIDGDGQDEIYVCQPGGLPNRLFRVRSNATFEDITERWGAGILDDTSAALFVDLRNSGRQDLVVLRSSGPILFLNDGQRLHPAPDAFRFATPPAGGFTGMAAADFDRDGKLDLYLCCYVYFQSEAQYTYASPYHDARNGPPNFLFRNRLNADGSGFLEDCTGTVGLTENNDRFSFAPAWCDFDGDGWPDLYVANDFGRNNLYRNREGRFSDIAASAGVEDIGPGMSASWFDHDGDGKPDLYVANMWTAAGQRLIEDRSFTPAAAEERKPAYRGHTKGNSLYQNKGDGTFADVSAGNHVTFGRWAWGSGGHDFDNDGHPEIFVTCGMLTNRSPSDLGSFFWREVVAHAPVTAAPSAAYENGWNALNQFIREDYSWNGREPNVFHVRRGERYFDFSGVSGLDFANDSRAFAVVDFDRDGRPDILLKSRLGPQLRVMQNQSAAAHSSIAFDLQGVQSNRDAIGASITVDSQTKWLEAGSGFLSQHSKRLIFGLGDSTVAEHVHIRWPSGRKQAFSGLLAGRVYKVVEGAPPTPGEQFRVAPELPESPLPVTVDLALEDTWFVEPVPLPEPQPGVQLLILLDGQKIRAPRGVRAKVIDFSGEAANRRHQYEVFRRYLFDWRTDLVTPIALLLNDKGDAVKIYASVPSESTCAADVPLIARPPALPFPGTFIKPPRRDFFKFGAAFLWAGYPEQALPYLQRTAEHYPENARVLVLIGQIHAQAGRLDAAANSFQAALQAQPGFAEAWSGLGDVADQRGHKQEALERYRKALSLKPDLFETLLNAGQVASQLDGQNAGEFYGAALLLNPKSPEAANGLGLALAKQGDAGKARTYFEQAISLRHDYTAAINNLGVLYLQQGKTNDAVAAFRYGIKVAPDEDILYLNLGRTYTRSGDSAKARGVMQELLDRKPGNAVAIHAIQELGSR